MVRSLRLLPQGNCAPEKRVGLFIFASPVKRMGFAVEPFGLGNATVGAARCDRHIFAFTKQGGVACSGRFHGGAGTRERKYADCSLADDHTQLGRTGDEFIDLLVSGGSNEHLSPGKLHAGEFGRPVDLSVEIQFEWMALVRLDKIPTRVEKAHRQKFVCLYEPQHQNAATGLLAL